MTRLEIWRRLLAGPPQRWHRLRALWQVFLRLALLVLVLCLGSASAWAQDEPATPPPLQWHTSEPVSLTVAMAGVVVMSAGFGLMLHTTQPCYCEPRTAWVIGGVAVVAAGLTLTWLGLRSRTVTLAPVVDRQRVGGMAAIRWGGHHE
jgi:hypothetical protein